MRKQILVLAVGALLAQTGWTRDKSDDPKVHPEKEQSIGMGSGAAIGALAGGPVGLIIGAAMGGWLGDRFHHEKVARAESEQQAGAAQAQAASLGEKLSATELELTASEAKLTASDAQLQSERNAHRDDVERAVALDVHFRTEDSTIDGVDEQRLAELASFIAPLDGTVIRLDGHADVRGTTKYNDALSTARAESVRDALVRAGMPAERIVVTGEGSADATATDQDTDGMALDRRVALTVVGLDDASRVAAETH
jgi:outer membrane protein OmpA-like peptidoglycan-associated protein